ncbi:MAG TPA: hypothetical protein VIG51_00445 [Candidatus Baltobacteraceae bacterium]
MMQVLKLFSVGLAVCCIGAGASSTERIYSTTNGIQMWVFIAKGPPLSKSWSGTYEIIYPRSTHKGPVIAKQRYQASLGEYQGREYITILNKGTPCQRWPARVVSKSLIVLQSKGKEVHFSAIDKDSLNANIDSIKQLAEISRNEPHSVSLDIRDPFFRGGQGCQGK